MLEENAVIPGLTEHRIVPSISSASLRRIVLFAVLPALLFYAATVFSLHWLGVPILNIIQDPGQVTGQARYVGLMSNIGAMVWFSTAAVALFSSYCVRGRAELAAGGHLLLVGGLLSLFLGGDDFFMLHDGPVPEKALFLLYALAALYVLRAYADVLRSLEPTGLLIACALLGMSVGIDVTQRFVHFPFAYEQLVEDGLKFVGIVAWAYFWMRAGSLLVARATAGSAE